MPEKCPVAPRIKGKTLVITSMGLAALGTGYWNHLSVMVLAIGLTLAIVNGCHPATTS